MLMNDDSSSDEQSSLEEAVEIPETDGSTDGSEEKITEKDQRIADHNAKQAEKLVKSNQELKAERDQYKNLLDSLRPEVVPQTAQQYQQPINQAPSATQFDNLEQEDIDATFKSMVDADGFLDGGKLLATLKGMNERAVRAEKAASVAVQATQQAQQTQQDFEKNSKMAKVHEKYPMLDPENDGFDEKFWKTVRNDLIGQYFEGREDPMEAADKWYDILYKDEVNKADTEKKVEAEDQKRQINATRPRSPMMTGYYESEEMDALKEQAKMGKKGSVAELLRRHEAALKAQ